MLHLVRIDGRRLTTGDTGQIYGPVNYAARSARHRSRGFFGTKQSRANRIDHSANRRPCIRQSTGVVDAMLGIASDTPRTISLAPAAACRKVAANYRRHRTGSIHAARNLLDPRAAQALTFALSGIQVIETDSDLRARPCRNKFMPPTKINHFVFHRNFRPCRKIDGDQ